MNWGGCRVFRFNAGLKSTPCMSIMMIKGMDSKVRPDNGLLNALVKEYGI